MRILIVNDGISDVGGVQVYLDSVVAELIARGHQLAIAYCTDSGREDADAPSHRLARFHLAADDRRVVLEAIRRWAPDVCYSHNMSDLTAERLVADLAPIVKFMHGYFGTCIGGQKMHGFPHAEACSRTFGPACVGLFLPRRCGRFSPSVLVEELRWAVAQRRLYGQYAAIVVASDHMRREYVANGVAASAVHVNPLFATHPADPKDSPVPDEPSVAFLGRMTRLKGGDLLIRSAHHASKRLGRPVPLLMMGDGPQRVEWEALAASLGVPCVWTGWVSGPRRWQLLRGASAVALPSVWPEPFGLVGLEGGALGVPAIAADVGGVREWLRDGVNGVLVPAPASAESFGNALAGLLADRTAQRTLRAGARRVASEMTVARHVDRLEPVLGQHSRPSVGVVA